MGIFADWAPIYWELGYSIIPVNKHNKGTYVEYNLYRDEQCSESQLDEWIKKYPDNNIGVVTGKASGIAVIDIDIKNNPELLNKVLSVFPRSPVERFGSKGLGILIKYNGQSHTKLRLHGKEIGEIITNTQIVIPPSIHPETKKPYKWTGYMTLDSDIKENVLDELPCPTDAEINECMAILESKETKTVSKDFKESVGRNDKLKTICGAMIANGFLPEKIAPLLLAEDYVLHPSPLFEDKDEFKSLHRNPLACAYKFATSIFKTYLNQASIRGDRIPHFNMGEVKEAKKKKEYAKYESFFLDILKKAKKDKIDDILKEKDWRGFWQPVGNSIKELKSYGTDIGLKPEKVDVHFRRFQKEKKSELLFDKVKWDGEDHIFEMMSYTASKTFTQDEMQDFIKHWISRIVKRVDTGDQNQMIILQGGQGVGKDLFIEALMGGFTPYLNNFTDTMQEKDIFMQIAKSLVINVSEFDKLNKKHPGLIKDLISRRTANFRPSHMQYFEDYRMNASFIGSTNPLNFLTDPTGNRRFWIFDEVKIDWSYPKDRGPQILAQALELGKENYTASVANIAKMNNFVLKLSPESLDSFVGEYWNDHFPKTQNPPTFSDMEYVFEKISKLMGFRSIKPVQSTIKRLGGRIRDTTGVRYTKVMIANNENEGENVRNEG